MTKYSDQELELAFFSNKGGLGKTSLVYHMSWMLAEMEHRVLTCDLDPQANLTAAFLDEDGLAELFDAGPTDAATVYRCVEPLTEVGDLREPGLQRISRNLALLPGDLALAGFEDFLSGEWLNSLGSTNLYRPFRLLKVADGAIGSHAQAVKEAHSDFRALSERVLEGIGLGVSR
jgi:cellulose biosynthesis protein BcsQ